MADKVQEKSQQLATASFGGFKETDFFFYRVYKELEVQGLFSSEKIAKDRNALIFLANEELKKFGGTATKKDEVERGMARAFKFINLGLEYLMGKTRQPVDESGSGASDEVKLSAAREILYRHSLLDIYVLGEKLFSQSRAEVKAMLSQAILKIGGLVFCLLDQADQQILEKISDPDKFTGTWAETVAAVDLLPKARLMLQFKSFLPLGEAEAYSHFRPFGSFDARFRASHIGLIRAILNSLLITGFFKKERQFEVVESDYVVRQLAQSFPRDISAANRDDLSKAICSGLEVEERDTKALYDAGGDLNLKFSRLVSVIAVTPEQVRNFVQIALREPEKLVEGKEHQREMFVWYFEVVAKALQTKSFSGQALKDALKLFDQMSDELSADIKVFNEKASGAEITAENIISFWRPRLIFIVGSGGGLSPFTKSAVDKKTAQEIPLSVLLEKPLAEVVDVFLVFFSSWPTARQKELAEKFPINLLTGKKENPWLLLRFFYRLFPTAPGWGEEFGIDLKTMAASPEAQTQALTKSSSSLRECTIAVFSRLNWEYLDAYFVSELWFKGSDLLRDLMWEKRAEWKITVPALKSHYLAWHQDLRLLQYALLKLYHQDKITVRCWEDLFWRAGSEPRLESFIRLVKSELEKKTKSKT